MTPLKKLLIAPFFGPLPEWMDKFTVPEGYDLLMDTDIESFRARVKNKLGIEYPGLPGTGKVNDYRCAFGVLYEEELKGYDYYGHCDLDMVFADNIDEWFPDEVLATLDIWSNHDSYICGPWTMYRNCKEVNYLFTDFPFWKDKMIWPETNGWVEMEYSQAVEKSKLKYRYSFHQGNPWTKNLDLKKNDGKLYQNDILIPMYHFRYLKSWPL